ncbi:MAG TPA: MarR family winged helix-turn-helix transcriptional regulator [Terriglobales bacterium]|nr:MarR family winged helix-turn-helix transcriptional regulator [Terriglobales bacterium]
MKPQDLAEISYHIVCLRSLGYRTAREHGLAPREYDLLLAVKAMPPGTRRGIRELADRLDMQHHGVVELATRLQRRGLLRRYHDQQDGRQARLALTAQGARLLRELVGRENARVRNSAAEAVSSLQRIVGKLPQNGNGQHGNGRHRNGNGHGNGW